MLPHLKRLLLEQRFNPYRLAGNAAVYSLDGAPSDMTYIVDGSGRLQLVADRSGNSWVNCWVSNGGAGNSASAPNKTVTGSFPITIDMAMADYTPPADRVLLDKLVGNDGFQVVLLTTGVPRLRVGNGSSVTNVEATTATGLTDLTRGTLGIVWEDGAGATFTVNGAALGSPVAAAVTLTNAVTPLVIGEAMIGNIYRVTVGGTYDLNPALASKLAATFSSGGDTWTINTSGDMGARICGARDLVQLTQAKQPIVSVAADGVNISTFDGTDDYMKAAPFPLSQPESVYWVGSQESWALNSNLFDGGTPDGGSIFQYPETPYLGLFAGTYLGSINSLPVGLRGVVFSRFNGLSSALSVNRGSKAVGAAGSLAMDGFTLGAYGLVTTRFANITFSEALIAARADSDALQLRIADALMRKWRVQP